MEPVPAIAPTSLHRAVQGLLAAAAPTIPDQHGFAAIVNLEGAHVGVATRVGQAWTFSADGGFNWGDATHGWQGQLQIGRTW